MRWFKVSSDVWSHPKTAGLTDRAFRVLVHSWAYAAQHQTDGRITKDALRLIGGRPQDARNLTEAGLWHEDGPGWVIHDWDDHQAAAIAAHEKRRRDREAAAERRRRQKEGSKT